MNNEPFHSGAVVPSHDESFAPKLADAISLSLEDLLPDTGGSIVIEGDGDSLAIQLVTDQSVVEHGVVDQLVTAAGEDVSGHAFFAFSEGLTVYYPSDVQLSIVALDG